MCLYIYLICMYVCISINYFSINGPVGIDIHILIYIYIYVSTYSCVVPRYGSCKKKRGRSWGLIYVYVYVSVKRLQTIIGYRGKKMYRQVGYD